MRNECLPSRKLKAAGKSEMWLSFSKTILDEYGEVMGTKKGQRRKTARRAYTRKKKITAASWFKTMVGKNGRGKDEMLDSYRQIMRMVK